MTTTIEWTKPPWVTNGETWNPMVGCSAASPGCDHCYAATVASRGLSDEHRGLAVKGQWSGEVRLLPDRLDIPKRWRKPRGVFVGSMTDVFHPGVPTEYIGRMWDVMVECPQHTFMVLTKRPKRIAKALGPNGTGFYAVEGPVPWPQPNIWIGTSVESAEYLWRIDALREAPAKVRFLSVEPLLGPLGPLDLTGIGWVIVGGESGRGARPMNPEWVLPIRDQCVAEGVPFFFKQWGEWSPEFGRIGKKRAGRRLDRNLWSQYPERENREYH